MNALNFPKIKKTLAELLPKFPVDFAYLYGSQAKGQTHAESDIDIALAFKNNLGRDPEDVLLDIFPILEGALQIPVEKIDLKNFDRLPLSVRFRVIRDGKLVYCANVGEHRKKTVDTVAKYHDEEPFFETAAQDFFERVSTL